MEYIKVILMSLGSLVFLFLVIKLIGNKSISQLNMFDYVNGITIGSIAADAAIAEQKDFPYYLVAMAVYGAVIFILSLITNKSPAMRRLITGKTITLFENGKIYKDNLKKARIDINEFLTQARVSGFFDISQLKYAFLEPNGAITFLANENYRPIVPDDVKLKVKKDEVSYTLISDGKILSENLKKSGFDEKWLRENLIKSGIGQISEVFYAYCSGNQFYAFKTENSKDDNDIFN